LNVIISFIVVKLAASPSMQKSKNKIYLKTLEKDNEVLFCVTKRQKLLLWFVVLICCACSVFVTVMTLSMTTAELQQEFNSISAARIWQVFLLLFGNVLTAVLMWMSGRYVLSVEHLTDGSLKIVVWNMFCIQQTKFFSTDVWQKPVSFHEGKTNFAGVPSVNAPWLAIKPKGSKKMIIDLQGEFPLGIDTLLAIVEPT